LRLLLGIFLILLGLIACAPAVPPGPSSTPAHSLPTSTSPPPAASAGRLAYIGGDGNIYVTTPELTSPIAVTHDATTSPENMGFSYHRISWSSDGQLAFASVTRSLTQTQSQLYVKASPETPARLVAQNNAHFVIYIYWSPVPCASAPSCRTFCI